MNQRAVTASLLHQVFLGQRLNRLLVEHSPEAYVQELVFGVLRHFKELAFLESCLIKKALKKKDLDVSLLIQTALYELWILEKPDYAVVSEAVEAASQLKKIWAKRLINAVLRNFLRQKENILKKLQQKNIINAPDWLIENIHHNYPEYAHDILHAMHQRPPLTLRLNLSKMDREQYLDLLAQKDIKAEATAHSDSGIWLHQARPVSEIPGFLDGYVSVQDEAAQLAANWLSASENHRILDACSAPGGKLCHLLEKGFKHVEALELDEARAARIFDNLKRLSLHANVHLGDGCKPEEWWDKKPFDRILLDAPCSATGIIRRYPDILLRRQKDDISKHHQTSLQLLGQLWPLLASGGELLYVTCSLLPEENENVIKRFLEQVPDAMVIDLPETSCAIKRPYGTQCLPGLGDPPFVDGLYYCRIRKDLS